MINLNQIKKQNKKFKITLFASYLLFATCILVAIYLLHVKYSANEHMKNLQSEITQEATYKNDFFNSFFEKHSDSISAIASNQILNDFITSNLQNDNNIKSLFSTLMKANSDYMQLRFLNTKGQEIIRIDRKQIGDQPTFVSKKELQNKSDRYYFKEAGLIQNNEIWYSNIDLNIEHKKIEKPIKPVFRIIKKVFVESKHKGFIIINIFMLEHLKTFTESSIFDVYLVDQEGYFLVHKNTQKNWSKYFSKDITVYSEFSIKDMRLSTKNSSFDSENKYFIQPISYGKNRYHLLYFENMKKVEKTQNEIRDRIIITILFAIFIAIPFAYVASSPAKKIYSSLYDKSNDISNLANNLEQKVIEEINKNQKKDRLLENQSKLAALGEMIGNIAHQWRHPITRVSLILQNIQTFKSLGKLSDELLAKYIKSALEQMDYMSETIDNFKDFYKPDIKKTIFSAKKSIGKAHKIIGATIKHSGIDIHIICNNDFLIQGYENQFSQVVLNILHNAKEALEDNKIESPCITVTLESQHEKNTILIEDNAGGISEENIQKIFDAYFTTKEETGTGIGLYMSKMIIEENFNANLYAKNTPKGALFTIELSKL